MTNQSSVTALVVDDDGLCRTRFADALRSLDVAPIVSPGAEGAIAELEPLRPALALIDSALAAGPARELFRRLTASGVSVIITAARPTIRQVVEAVRAGASDVLDKTATDEAVRRAIQEACANGAAGASVSPAEYDQLFHRSAVMAALEPRILHAAAADVPVLLQGEPGVGKSLVAQIVHAHSRRRGRPLVRADCRALPPDLLEVELFGEESARPGRLALADGGTLVVEEIGDLPPPLQARLLRVLVDGEFYRAGGRALVRADVRIVATTRHDPRERSRGVDRRLSDRFAAAFTIPPLRDRRDEIPSLLEYFVDKWARELDRPRAALGSDVVRLCAAYSWPGNVGELDNLVKRFVLLGDEAALRADLETRVRVARIPPSRIALPNGLNLDAGLRALARDAARHAEWAVIRQVLEEVQWNRAAAARRLKISYKTLLNKLKHGAVRARRGRPSGAPP